MLLVGDRVRLHFGVRVLFAFRHNNHFYSSTVRFPNLALCGIDGVAWDGCWLGSRIGGQLRRSHAGCMAPLLLLRLVRNNEMTVSLQTREVLLLRSL